MYANRKNKEKVSRVIGGGNGSKQRAKKKENPTGENIAYYSRGVDYIQRKIGFEFQTHGGNINVKKWENRNACFPEHGELIYEGAGFRMETDGTDLEYVTEAVDESDAVGLEQKVTNASKLHMDILGSKLKHEKFKDRGWYYMVDNGTQNYLIYKSGQRNAHPQATVGINLNKVYSFMNEMVNTRSKQIETIGYGGTTSKVNKDKQKKAVKAAISNITSINGLTDKGRGFMAIIEQYIDVCKTFSSKWPVNAKNAMPFMSRSNLYSYWKALDNDEQNAIEIQINKLGENVIIAKEKNNGGSSNLTLKNWFDNLKKGNDTLSSFHSVSNLSLTKEGEPNKEMQKYNIKNPLDIGDNRIGLLLELRAMKREVPPEKWPEVAEAVRKIVASTNQKQMGESIFSLTEISSYKI